MHLGTEKATAGRGFFHKVVTNFLSSSSSSLFHLLAPVVLKTIVFLYFVTGLLCVWLISGSSPSGWFAAEAEAKLLPGDV